MVAVLVVWATGRDGVSIGRYPGSLLVRAGFVAGVPALLAYDSSRLLVSELAAMEISPFDAFPHFGGALIGQDASETARRVTGAGFHVVNGLSFAVAFAIVFRAKGIVAGIVWGLGLEAAMLGVYPWWLQIEQLGEFVGLSVIGHVSYGATLGAVTKWRLRDHPGAIAGKERVGC
jgi:hypothetical protein